MKLSFRWSCNHRFRLFTLLVCLTGIMDNSKDDNSYTTTKAVNEFAANSLTPCFLNRHNSYKESKTTTEMCKFLVMCTFSYKSHLIKCRKCDQPYNNLSKLILLLSMNSCLFSGGSNLRQSNSEVSLGPPSLGPRSLSFSRNQTQNARFVLINSIDYMFILK